MRLARALAVALLLVPSVSAWGRGAGEVSGARSRDELLARDELGHLDHDHPTSLDLSDKERDALFSSLGQCTSPLHTTMTRIVKLTLAAMLALDLVSSSAADKPDCFRSVAAQLRARCTPSTSGRPGEEDVVNEHDRVDGRSTPASVIAPTSCSDC
jgi:hypothetical protein